MHKEEGALPGPSDDETSADTASHPSQYGGGGATALPQRTPELLSDHLVMLKESAISEEVHLSAGVRSILRPEDLPQGFEQWQRVTPGLLFRRDSVAGVRTWQYRPDQPPVIQGKGVKYLSPPGEPPVLAVHDWMRPAVLNPITPLVIVEGTKQYLAAVTALGSGSTYAAVGMQGCWGWSSDKAPSPDLVALPMQGREVIVVMDADVRSNPDVYDAAERLASVLKNLRGAREVRFVNLAAQGSLGLDDVLARLPATERPAAMSSLIASAEVKLGPRPKAASGRFVSFGSILIEELALDICSQHELAIGQDREVWVYRDGVYVYEVDFLAGQIARRLGDAYRSTCVSSVKDVIKADLADRGRVIPDQPGGRWLNVANGMLDPLTETLVSHGPEFLSIAQIPVEWDPEAKAPRYETWLAERVGSQAQDLEESVSMMLDPSRVPPKALLLFGPSRSGKSTFQRLASAMVGERNVSSVTLHALAENRFASANLVGKMLNTAADLSSQHVEDLAVFKMVTGGDRLTAERKGQQHFQFINRAMLLFSANTIPSVGESSTAYLERIKPFEFGSSFAGTEDPEIEDALLHELPGVLLRWVRALQERRRRGSFLPTQPGIAKTFATGSDQVRWFLDEKTIPDPAGVRRSALYEEYKRWSQESGLKTLSNRNFYTRVKNAGVEEYRHREHGWCFQVRIVDPNAPVVPEDLWGTPRSMERDTCDSLQPLPASIENQASDSSAAEQECSESVTTVTAGSAGLLAKESDLEPLHVLPGQAAALSTTTRGLSDRTLIGHGLLSADLEALCGATGWDVGDLASRCRDLLLLARLDDPAPGGSKPGEVRRRYAIESLAARHQLPWNDDPRTQTSTLIALAARYPMTNYGRREHRVMGILGQMRLTGFRVDEARLDTLLASQAERRGDLIQRLAEEGLPLEAKDGSLARDPLNTESGRAFLADHFSKLGIELGSKPSGEVDTSKEALTELAENLSEDHPARAFALLVMQARSGNTVLQQVKDNLRDGRVHPFVDAAQATGRFSITRPGLTVMHKKYGREIFLPEPGHVIITADLAQIDARAIAAHCQDPAYLALFDEGRDLHAEVAERVLGGIQHRRVAKVLNHATSYGAGAALIARTAGVTLNEARRFLADMEAAYPQWAEWRRDTIQRAQEGELLDNGFGRKVRPNPDRVATTAVAMVGQSCARDLLVECLFRLDEAGLIPHLRMVVHDEVVLSVPAADLEDYRGAISDCMTLAWAPGKAREEIPVYASVGAPASTWGAAS